MPSCSPLDLVKLVLTITTELMPSMPNELFRMYVDPLQLARLADDQAFQRGTRDRAGRR